MAAPSRPPPRRGHLKACFFWACTAAAGGGGAVAQGAAAAAPAAQRGMKPLLGEYGFLSQFDGLTDEEARQRVRRMVVLFGIKEFEFYNAFEGYSHPPWVGKQHWRCTCLGTKVSRSVLLAYTDEIRKQGGRSWLSVQAMGVDPGQAQGATVLGTMKINGKPLFDVIAPSAARARKAVPAWAAFASSLGFSGILWGTLGDYQHSSSDHGTDLAGFLRAAQPLLQARNLDQTCNFVDGFGWKKELVEDKLIAFTYWSAPQGCSIEMKPGSVYVCAGKKEFDVDTIVHRWRRARCVGSTYLAVGDGSRRLQTDYYPDAIDLTDEDMIRIKGSVFDSPACSPEPRSTSAAPAAALATTVGPAAAALSSTVAPLAIVATDAPGQGGRETAVVVNDANTRGGNDGVVFRPSRGASANFRRVAATPSLPAGPGAHAPPAPDASWVAPRSSGCSETGVMSLAASYLGVGCDASEGLKRKMAGMWAIWGLIFLFLAILVGQGNCCGCCGARRAKRDLQDSEYTAATLAS